MVLSQFSIQGLYGKYNIALKVEDNKLILVAKNGASKTTVLKLIFFFLTKQWENLATIEFDKIIATINDQQYIFDRDKYNTSEISNDQIPILIKAYPIYENFIRNELQKWTIQELREKSHYVELFAESYDVPAGLLAKFIETALMSRVPTEDSYDWKQYVIYLPTYRRIEEEFPTIFSDFNHQLTEYVDRLIGPRMQIIGAENFDSDGGIGNPSVVNTDRIFDKLWSNRDREKWLKKRDTQYLELVEFGMDDISYKVGEIVKSEGNLEKAGPKLSKYLDMCNKYLYPEKKIEFVDSCLRIALTEDEGRILSLEKLSSGEKQVVALFFHLFIEEMEPFVIIDEPEISLSLRWQESILEDILAAEIAGFVVATHSPFVIGKELKDFAHSINEFMF
jgi:predicted ATP-binding protein involved in virulence